MKDNRYELNAAKEIPLLGQEEIKSGIYVRQRIRFKKRKRIISTFKKVYFCFVVVICVFVLIILQLRHNRSKDNIFVNDTTEPLYSETCSTENTESDIPVIKPSDSSQIEESDKAEKNDFSLQELYSFDPSLVPNGEKAIIPIDLSMYTSGAAYINNQTGFVCDLEVLLKRELHSYDYELINAANSPKVLIIHTHATEAYSKEGANSYSDQSAEIARSLDYDENVVSLGVLMADALNELEIPTVHCDVMHDSIQNKDSYLRSANTIKNYLEKYPTIELVIDIHRDSVMSPDGEMLRPVTLVESEPAAQVMCVVGSDWLGGKCDRWQDNLSLALKLREYLNGKYTNLCRPPQLRGTSYNQELSRYSLHIEVGASGNDLKEAKISCELVANAIAEILFKVKK